MPTRSMINDDILLELIRCGFMAWPQSNLLQTQKLVPGDIFKMTQLGCRGNSLDEDLASFGRAYIRQNQGKFWSWG